MQSPDSTAQTVDALIQANAFAAAANLVRADVAPLVAHVGLRRVTEWCAQLGLDELLDLPRALAAAHVAREQKGSAAVHEFLAVARLANARADGISEFHALAEIYSTGFLLWTGFGDMQRNYARINALYDRFGAALSPHDAVVCLPGLLAARLLYGTSPDEAASVGERVVALVHDTTLPARLRLRAATMLMPWFEHTQASDRLKQTITALSALENDPVVASSATITHLTYQAAAALATAYNLMGRPQTDALADVTALIARADETGLQWLRFFVRRVAFECANSIGATESAAHMLDALEAALDVADASQVLAVRLRQSKRAFDVQRFAEALEHGKRCVELSEALEMPVAFSQLYQYVVTTALLGLNRLDESIDAFDRVLAIALPGYRLRFERIRAIAVVLRAVEAQQTAAAQADPAATHERALAVRNDLVELVRICGDTLPPIQLRSLPTPCARVAAALFEHGMDSAALIKDVHLHQLVPPESRPVTWPWHLRIRLFDGFVCDGLANTALDAGKKGESKSAQILQYLAAHAPASVAAQRLADALWPEAEGDKAMRSLDVALTRLRPTLPDATLIVRHDGKIGFDRRRVWCDSDAALMIIEEIRARAHGRSAAQVESVTAESVHWRIQARSALALLEIYRGPLLPDSREAFARDRADYFRSQVAGAVQIGLRAAVRLTDSTAAEEIIRLSVSHGLPASLVRSVIADLASMGDNTSRRAAELNDVFELARR